MHKMQLNKRKTSFYVNDPADYRPAPEKNRTALLPAKQATLTNGFQLREKDYSGSLEGTPASGQPRYELLPLKQGTLCGILSFAERISDEHYQCKEQHIPKTANQINQSENDAEGDSGNSTPVTFPYFSPEHRETHLYSTRLLKLGD